MGKGLAVLMGKWGFGGFGGKTRKKEGKIVEKFSRNFFPFMEGTKIE